MKPPFGDDSGKAGTPNAAGANSTHDDGIRTRFSRDRDGRSDRWGTRTAPPAAAPIAPKPLTRTTNTKIRNRKEPPKQTRKKPPPVPPRTAMSVRLPTRVFNAVRAFCDAAEWPLSAYAAELIEADLKARGEL